MRSFSSARSSLRWALASSAAAPPMPRPSLVFAASARMRAPPSPPSPPMPRRSPSSPPVLPPSCLLFRCADLGGALRVGSDSNDGYSARRRSAVRIFFGPPPLAPPPFPLHFRVRFPISPPRTKSKNRHPTDTRTRRTPHHGHKYQNTNRQNGLNF